MSGTLGQATLESGFDPSGLLADMRKARGQTESYMKGWAGSLRQAFTTGIGFLGAQVFSRIVAGIKSVVAAGFDIVTTFEQTGVAFRTMLGDADLARGLLNELAQFAARTPFSLPDVEAGAKQLLAMGASIKDIIPELSMLGDVAAGLSVPIGRLIQNYGQVRTQTRLTGRELRDFNMAGVPLIAELAKQFNITAGEVAGMVEAGKVGFADVQQAFSNMTSEGGKFFNLMENQSLTTAGRISNLKDNLTILARTLGTPLLSPLNRLISGFGELASMFGPGGPLYRATLAASAFTSVILDMFADMVQGTNRHLNSIGDQASNTFISMARRALKWGIDVIGQFAIGLIRGATQALTQAMNFISSIFTFWLRPQSPPNLLPNIDVWGTQTFNEYLRGFLDADFGILKSLQSPIKTALENIENLAKSALSPDDKAGANNLARQTVEVYASLSAGIAEAIGLAKTTGVVSENIISEMKNALGEYGGEIASVLRLELNLAAAVRKVGEEQKALARAQKVRTEAEQELAIAQADNLFKQRFGTDLQEQDDAEYRVFLAEEALFTARLQEKQAQANVDVAEEGVDALKQQLSTQQNIVDQLLDMQSMQIDPMMAMRETAEKIKEGVGDIKSGMEDIASLFESMPDITPLAGGIDQAFEDMKSEVKKHWDEMIENLKIEWNQFLDKDIPGFTKAWKGMVEGARQVWDTYLAPILVPIWDKLFPQQPKDFDPFGDAGNKFSPSDGSNAFGDIGQTAGKLLVIAAAIKAVTLVLSPFLKLWGWVGAAWTFLGGLAALAGISGGISWGAGGGVLIGIGSGILALTWPILALIAAIGLLVLAWINLKDRFIENWTYMSEQWNALVDAIKLKLMTWVAGMIATLIVWWEDVKQWWSDGWEYLKNLVSTKTAEIWATFTAWIAEMVALGQEKWAQFKENTSAKWDEIKSTILTKLTNIKTDITTWLSELVSKVKNKATDMKTAGGNLIQGVWDGLKNKWTELETWWEGVIDKLSEIWDRLTMSKSPSRLFMERGQWIGEGVRLGLEKTLPSIENVMGSMVGGMSSKFGSLEYAMASLGSVNYVEPAGYSDSGGPGDTLIFYVKDTTMREEIDGILRERALVNQRVRY